MHEVEVFDVPHGKRKGKRRTETIESRPMVITDRAGQLRLDGYLEVDRFIFQNDPEGLSEWVRTVHARGGRAFLADDEADYYFTAHLGEVFRLEPRGPLWEVLPRSPGPPSEASR